MKMDVNEQKKMNPKRRTQTVFINIRKFKRKEKVKPNTSAVMIIGEPPQLGQHNMM